MHNKIFISADFKAKQFRRKLEIFGFLAISSSEKVYHQNAIIYYNVFFKEVLEKFYRSRRKKMNNTYFREAAGSICFMIRGQVWACSNLSQTAFSDTIIVREDLYSLVQWIGYTFDAIWSQIYFIPHQKCIQFTGPNCTMVFLRSKL